MRTSLSKTALPTIVSTLIATLLIQACSSGPAVVAAQSTAADPIQGLWSSEVNVTSCSGGATLRTFAALNLFGQGGTLIDTDAQPPTGHGPGFGTWSTSGASQYTGGIRFFRFNTDGTLAGSQQINRTISLAADGKSFTSTLAINVLDLNGNILMTACGTENATRATFS